MARPETFWNSRTISHGLTCWRAALQRSGMEMLKQLFDTRMKVPLGDAASASTTTFATKPWTSWTAGVGGTRDGHRDATGGAWPDADSASRCHGARWEISYTPYTCVTCRPHVRLHAMEIVTRQVAPHMARFRTGCHPPDGLSRHYCLDARGSRTVGSREKPLKPSAGWIARSSGSWTRARRGCGAAMQAGPASAGRREDRARHRRSGRVLWHPCSEL